MFTNELGTNLSPHPVYNNFKQVVAPIGYSDVRFHDLRYPNAKPKTKILVQLNGGMEVSI